MLSQVKKIPPIAAICALAGLAPSCSTAKTIEPPPTRTVSSVVVSGMVTIIAGTTSQLSAAVRDQNNAVIQGATVTWASDNTPVASVSATGLVAGQSVGSATITATSGGESGTATVTVNPVPVASVAVSPPSSNLSPAQTVQLTADPRDASGNSLSGRTVTWATSDQAVATVSTNGLATAVANGTATITATSEGVDGTASVTVGSAPSTLANECASPQAGWIWCDDFDQNRLSSYFEYDNASGAFVRANGVGNDGSWGMEASFAQGAVSVGSLHLAFGNTPQSYFAPVDAGTANYREIYWRMYVMHEAGWTGGGGDKLSRAHLFASTTSWAQAMAAPVWSGQGGNASKLSIDPTTGIDSTTGNLVATGYNQPFAYLGQKYSTTPIFDAAHVGSWYCIEAYVKVNDSGQSNGEFLVWIDDQLEIQSTGLNLIGTYSTPYGLNAVFFENYWNAGSTKAQKRYFDNIVVSTQRIGCP